MSDPGADHRPLPLALTEREVESRRRFAGLEEADSRRMASLRGLMMPKIDQLVDGFFDCLARFPEAQTLFANRSLLDEAKRQKREHLSAMFTGEYGVANAEERARLGQLYSRAGLEARVFIGAFRHLLTSLGAEIAARFADDPKASFEHLTSLNKIGFFDVSLMTDILVGERERTISQQQEAIRELSTPVLQVRDRLLILPIIGLIDSQRAKQLTDDLLRSIRSNRAKVVVMDITGVAAVDSKVANHFIQTVAAARLMGTTVIITGLSPEVAQSLVALGVDLGGIATVGDLQGGLEEAERMIGYKVIATNDVAASSRAS